MRYQWTEEILSVVEFMKMGHSDIMKMAVCDRRTNVFAHNQMMKKQEEEAENKRNLQESKSRNKRIKR